MKTKTILNTSGALITIGGITAGSYYGLNSKFSKPAVNQTKKDINPTKQREIGIAGKRSIRETLTNKGLTLLNTKTTENNQTWENLIKKHLDKQLSAGKKIGALIEQTTNKAIDDERNMANIKKACDDLFEKSEDKDRDFAKNEALAEDWCTSESKLLQ